MLRKVIILTLLTIGLALPAQSTPLNSGDTSRPSSFFNIIMDGPWNSHDEAPQTSYFNFDASVGRITSAIFTFTHWGNYKTRCADENWYLTGNNDEFIGNLKESKPKWGGLSNGWLTQSWELSSNIITGIMEDEMFELNFMEDTDGADWLLAKDMTLDFLYDTSIQPVPEPSTVLLLGLGLIGFAVVMRKNKV